MPPEFGEIMPALGGNPTIKPAIVPTFATDPTLTGGPQVGLSPRLDPGAGVRAQGLYQGRGVPARALGWLLGTVGDWLGYFVNLVSDVGPKNWTLMSTSGVAALPAAGTTYGIFAAPLRAGNGSNLFVFGTGSGAPIVSRTKQGVEWTAYPGGLAATTRITDMAANANAIVLVGPFTGNQSGVSTNDGVSYSQVANHGAFNYTSVCELNGTFYATGSTTAIGKSTGAVAWTATAGALASSAQFIRAASSITTLLVLDVGNKTNVSTDGGATWTRSASVLFSGGPNQPADIRWNAGLGLWMAISTEMEVKTSTDGLTWTQVHATVFGTSITSATLATDDADTWVAAFVNSVTNFSHLCYSTDAGVTWKQLIVRDVAPSALQAAAVCYSALQGCFYAIFKDIANAKEPAIFQSLSVGSTWPSVG